MRLVNTEYNIDITFRENEVNVLSVENERAFSEIAQSLWQQANGSDGSFVLSEEDKILKIDSACRCIFNPFSLDCNERKIINKVYSEIEDNATDIFSIEHAKINKENYEFLEKLLATVPYPLVTNYEVGVAELLKLYDAKFELDCDTVAERIVEYMRICHKVLGVELFVYYNLKQYMTDEQLILLYEFVRYEKIHILIVEGNPTRKVEGERHCIIDRDLCIIDINPYE